MKLTKNEIKQKRAELVGTRGSHPEGSGVSPRRPLGLTPEAPRSHLDAC